ncbi:DUF2846 domain-containing protein [Terricaulis sp.]|uniref:DUF2846 domain-containing protein n=1 Tax=Terricaulis sp. TaxID=2768686 RepID=UPI00378495F2
MKWKISAFAACVAAAAMAGVAFAQDTTTAPAEQTATEQTAAAPEQAADETTNVGPALPSMISAPPEGKGQIVFFRPNRFVGAALSFTVRENDAALGRLPNARYFVHVAEPGIHEYEIGRNDTMRIEIEPGATYFVMQNTTMGVVAGRAVLTPSDQAAFEAAVGRMRVSDPIEN